MRGIEKTREMRGRVINCPLVYQKKKKKEKILKEDE